MPSLLLTDEFARELTQNTDLTGAQVSVQDIHGRASIHGTGSRAAAELEASRQWGTVSTGKGYCLPWRGCGPAIGMLSFTQAVDDVFPANAHDACTGAGTCTGTSTSTGTGTGL